MVDTEGVGTTVIRAIGALVNVNTVAVMSRAGVARFTATGIAANIVVAVGFGVAGVSESSHESIHALIDVGAAGTVASPIAAETYSTVAYVTTNVVVALRSINADVIAGTALVNILT